MAGPISNKTLKGLMIAAGIVLVIALFKAGLIVPMIALILILLVLGGGALLYRMADPPER